MSDPKRLIDGNDPGGSLLASALSDAPRPGTRERVAEALGLTPPGGIPKPSGSTGSAGDGVAGPHKGPGLSMAAGSHPLLWGLLAATTLAGALLLEWGDLQSRGNGSSREVRLEASEHATMSEPTLEPAAEPSAAPAPATSAEAPRVRSSTRSIIAPGEGFLTRELHLLDAARAALERADTGDALAELDRYDRAFPLGALRAEASILRIKALFARREDAQARALAREVLARDPSGPHARRLRELLEKR